MRTANNNNNKSIPTITIAITSPLNPTHANHSDASLPPPLEKEAGRGGRRSKRALQLGPQQRRRLQSHSKCAAVVRGHRQPKRGEEQRLEARERRPLAASQQAVHSPPHATQASSRGRWPAHESRFDGPRWALGDVPSQSGFRRRRAGPSRALRSLHRALRG